MPLIASSFLVNPSAFQQSAREQQSASLPARQPTVNFHPEPVNSVPQVNQLLANSKSQVSMLHKMFEHSPSATTARTNSYTLPAQQPSLKPTCT